MHEKPFWDVNTVDDLSFDGVEYNIQIILNGGFNIIFYYNKYLYGL